MNNLFDLDYQNLHLSEKITAGIERLATVGRSLLWQEAQEQRVSPIQFQILAFLYGHSHFSVTLTGLAREFGVTKATISDAVKSLEAKELISRTPDPNDKRLLYIHLMDEGRDIVMDSANYLSPIVAAIDEMQSSDLVIAWKVISTTIHQLSLQNVIHLQRMCFSCRHYSLSGNEHHCALLGLVLHDAQIRLDCPEHQPSLPAAAQ
jgi:DNA-binding MarR family transcriptional regulator